MQAEKKGNTLHVSGLDRLTAGNGVEFKRLVESNLSQDVHHLAIDFSKVAVLDSPGLGTLVSLRRKLADRDGAIQLLHPQPFVLDLLEMMRLQEVFEIVPT
jgi:anti-anti-sigma factor